MPKISQLPDGGNVQDGDQFVIARGGSNFSIFGSKVRNVFVMMAATYQLNPADATNYWMNMDMPYSPSPFTGVNKIYVPSPRASILRAIFVSWDNWSGTASSNEPIEAFVQINATATSLGTVANTNKQKLWKNTALALAVPIDAYFSVKIKTPTWATNPDNVNLNWTGLFEGA